jgi:hypothetical protein
LVVLALAVTGNAVGGALLATPAQAAPAGPAANISLQLSASSIPADGTSTTTATATVTDGLIPNPSPIAGEPVTFSSSDPTTPPITTTDNGNGTYVATITSSKKAGPVTITAADPAAGVSVQQPLTQTPGPAANVSVELTPGSIQANKSSTSTAKATVTDANGNPVPGETVHFKSTDPDEKIRPTTDHGDGTYTATIISSTTPGQVIITATDDSSQVPNMFATARLTQGSGTTTTSLTTQPAAAVTNQVVTLIATVTASLPGVPPAGTVTFESGGAPIGGCARIPVASSGQSATVTCQASFSAAVSPQQITASFVASPGSVLADSQSAPDALVVGRGRASAALSVPGGAVRVGSPTSYRATLQPAYPGAALPTGSVEFLDRGRRIASCARRPVTSRGAAAVATCRLKYKRSGEHVITFRYGGDSNFTGSSSSSRRMTVGKRSNAALNQLSSTMLWGFHYFPTYTKVDMLLVEQAPVNLKVTVACHALGCPYATRVTRVTKPKWCATQATGRCSPLATVTVDLGRSLRGQHLGSGGQLVVRLSLPGFIAKSYVFTFRSHRGPQIQIR